MSELSKLNRSARRTPAFWLSNVSMLALMLAVTGSEIAEAADSDVDHPTVWIELGGQMERQTGQSSAFVPPFVANNPDSPAFEGAIISKSQNPTPFTNGAQGSLTFAPKGSDWVFSASVRYGRASGETRASQQPPNRKLKIVLPPTAYYTSCGCYGTHNRTTYSTGPTHVFGNTDVRKRQTHLLLDFQAGKDVGLGFLGPRSSSVLGVGVRIAQFSSRMSTTIHAIPSVHVVNVFGEGSEFYAPSSSMHSYTEIAKAARSFHGVGPSVSWKISTELAGREKSMSLDFDSGINASVLFGRQRASVQHQTSAYFLKGCNCTRFPTYVHVHDTNRSRGVTVPNIGAFAGLSLKFPNAKVSLGYRGDFFFGAMDTGIDTRKTSTVGFYGPYASISIGLGG
ncbi:MAG TPA: hypothetical protein VMS78_15450 [Rhizomicrobium sp.]|nr:hypothetical protein [Rhizomicrobium sp.]